MNAPDLARAFCQAFHENGSRTIVLFADETFETMPEPERKTLLAAFEGALSRLNGGKTYTETCEEILQSRAAADRLSRSAND